METVAVRVVPEGVLRALVEVQRVSWPAVPAHDVEPRSQLLRRQKRHYIAPRRVQGRTIGRRRIVRLPPAPTDRGASQHDRDTRRRGCVRCAGSI